MTRKKRQLPLRPLPRRGRFDLISRSIFRHEPARPRDHRRRHDASGTYAAGEVWQPPRRGGRGIEVVGAVGAVGKQDEVAWQRDLVRSRVRRGRGGWVSRMRWPSSVTWCWGLQEVGES